jgi:3-methyladenine DNA glycosylase AlkD
MVKKRATTKPRSTASKNPDAGSAAGSADILSAAAVLNVDEVMKAIEIELGALARPNVAAIRAVRRQFSRQLAKAAPEKIIELAQRILRHPGIPRFVAYELIQHHRPALQSLTAATLEGLGTGNDTWDKVDTFACYLSGPVWRERQVPDKLIERWAQSKNRWWRRTAVVSTVPLNNKARGGRGDAERTLLICRMLVEDRDDMVVKALSWALRELSKRDSGAVKKFLEENAPALAPRIIREVKNKLQTGLKNPR